MRNIAQHSKDIQTKHHINKQQYNTQENNTIRECSIPILIEMMLRCVGLFL